MTRDTRQMSPQARLEHLLELGGNRCAWCGYDLEKPNARPTRDMLVPKVKGGPTRLENEVAACSSCNQKRGHSDSPSQWLEACRNERGLDPDADKNWWSLAFAVPEAPDDSQAQLWLAKDRYNLPVRVVFMDARGLRLDQQLVSLVTR